MSYFIDSANNDNNNNNTNSRLFLNYSSLNNNNVNSLSEVQNKKLLSQFDGLPQDEKY